MQNIKALLRKFNTKELEDEFNALNILDSNITELLSRINKLEERNLRYYCAAWNDAVQTIPAGVLTAVTLNQSEYPQYGNMHDNVNSNARIHIRRNGVYYIFGGVQFEASAAGNYREVSLSLTRNGVSTQIAVHSSGPAGGVAPLHLPVSTARYLYVDDYIRLMILHDTPGGIDIELDPMHSPYLVVSERREDLTPSEYGLLNPEANMR